MNVLYATDEHYLRHAAASMVSLCEHTAQETALRIHLLSLNIPAQETEKLRAMLENYGRTLEVWELGNSSDWFNFPINSRGFSPNVLARLLLARVLPEDVARVLYLDCDTIILGDIAPLEHFDLQGCPVGMAQETTVRHAHLRALGLSPEQRYYNSGVLLIDLKRWRREGIESAILSYYRLRGGALLAPDQDALNGALPKRICPLPPKYNYGSAQIYYPYRAQAKMCAPAPFYPSAEAYEAAARPPVIVHYLGEERPWRAGNRHPYREAYASALAKTPWRDVPQEQGWRLYFACFAVFNRLTHRLPMLRWRVINALIPAFMHYRERKLVKSRGN